MQHKQLNILLQPPPLPQLISVNSSFLLPLGTYLENRSAEYKYELEFQPILWEEIWSRPSELFMSPSDSSSKLGEHIYLSAFHCTFRIQEASGWEILFIKILGTYAGLVSAALIFGELKHIIHPFQNFSILPPNYKNAHIGVKYV